MWNVELTRKKVPSNKMREGSGEKPGMIGLISAEAMM
jgi:hypothetical protein